MPTAPEPVPRASHRWRRWLAIAALSVLAHLAALDLLPDWTLRAGRARTGDEPLRATLMPAIRPADPVPATSAPDVVAETAPQARPKPRPVPRPRIARPPSAPPPADFVPESVEPVPQVAVGSPAGDAPTAVAQAGVTAAATVDASALPEPVPAAPATPVVATPAQPSSVAPAPPPAAPPRSARLDYKVLYVDARNASPTRYYGVGSIDWTIDGDRYRSELVAAVDFLLFKVNVLASHSDGSLVAGGLAPDRYSETPRKRATVATNFNRDARQDISFSASATTVPLQPGTQDRLSVLFQIGALLRAGGDATTADAIEVPVAGVRGDVDTWRFENRGDETIDAAGALLVATHLRRAPRPGSNDRTIDVWVAARDGGYPARVLYTEPNGSTIEMTLDRIGTVAP